MCKYNKARYSCYSLQLHIVFLTDCKVKIFGENHLARLKDIFAELSPAFDATLAHFSGQDDHVHLVLDITPKTPNISKIINSFKAVSSRKLRAEFEDISQGFCRDVLWSRYYFVGTDSGKVEKLIAEFLNDVR